MSRENLDIVILILALTVILGAVIMAPRNIRAPELVAVPFQQR